MEYRTTGITQPVVNEFLECTCKACSWKFKKPVLSVPVVMCCGKCYEPFPEGQKFTANRDGTLPDPCKKCGAYPGV
jgi:hypothetical protein